MIHFNRSVLKITLILFVSIVGTLEGYGQEGSIKGRVIDSDNKKGVPHIYIALKGTDFGTYADDNGVYALEHVPYGEYQIGFLRDNKQFLAEDIKVNRRVIIKDVEVNVTSKFLKELVVSSYRKDRNKLEDITRLPIKPYEDIQNVYVLDNKLIKETGALEIADVVQNIAGVYTFATYGGVRESMSIRGFRGIPILKNGILISKDIGGRGFANDMIGVEDIQVIKGSDAINMGEATSYGNAGGLINIVTKTPHFSNKGFVGMRVGTNNQYRPTFDIETTLGEDEKAAFRIDGAFESTRTYQNLKNIGGQSFYFNPSLSFRPDDHTEIILEMDHYNTTNSFDPGTVNLSVDNSNRDLYRLPKKKFLGFESDKTNQTMTTGTVRIKRYLNNKFYLRGAVFFSDYNTAGPSVKLTPLESNPSQDINVDKNTLYSRVLERHKEHSDKNFVAQIDFVGDHVRTGKFTHTLQGGVDFRSYTINQRKYNSIAIDTIDIHQPVSNRLPANTPDFTLQSETPSTTRSTGFSAQEYVDFNNRIKAKVGMRVGIYNSETPTSPIVVNSSYFNPFAGLMLRIWKDINVFGNYAQTTDPSTAEFLDIHGQPLGNETFKQFETGIRTSWFDHRLRADLVYYHIDNDGMNIQQTVQDENGISQTLGYYFKGGHVRYQGVELDIKGRLTRDLSVNLGFSKMKAKYIKSDVLWIGSSPKNIPDYTANVRLNYFFTTTNLKGLSIGTGYYYLGKRPYNDWIQVGADYHGITPGLAPWDVPAYSQWNAYIGYDFKFSKNKILQGFDIRLVGNNLADSKGYNAYRDKNINLIAPRNGAFLVNYRF